MSLADRVRLAQVNAGEFEVAKDLLRKGLAKEFHLSVGDVVQLNPETVRNKAFAGCFMVVSEPKGFGAQGYITAVGEKSDTPVGLCYYRANFDEMFPIGRAEWTAD